MSTETLNPESITHRARPGDVVGGVVTVLACPVVAGALWLAGLVTS